MEELIIFEVYFMNFVFWELDIEFFRVLVWEWLEVVLEEDLDKYMSLEDLLVDGMLLYRVF